MKFEILVVRTPHLRLMVVLWGWMLETQRRYGMGDTLLKFRYEILI